MKKRIKNRVNFVFEWGMKGIKISLVVLWICFIGLILFSLFYYPSEKVYTGILRVPENRIDLLAVLGGVIIFIALPFLIGVFVGINSKKSRGFY